MEEEEEVEKAEGAGHYGYNYGGRGNLAIWANWVNYN